MERLEVIVQAGELKPKDVVRMTLDGGPNDPERKVISIKPNNGSGFDIVFQIGKSVWPSMSYHQNFVLVHRPYPEGKTAEDMLNGVFALASSLPGRMWPMSEESLQRLEVFLPELRKSLEALELGMSEK